MLDEKQEKQIEMLARNCSWQKDSDSDKLPPTARAYIGSLENARVLVVDFDISDQGFAAGSRGYDGAVTINKTVIRLPRSLAARIFCVARAAFIKKLRVKNSN